jgi:CheY-like chemotaxis protein/nitrogen-specific signal transduction histidine kinase
MSSLQSPERYRLLVVDDTDANRYVVVRYLRSQGFTVEESALGRDALERIAANLPDLIVLDIRLPDISGLEITRTLRADPRTTTVPILHLSASFTDTRSRAAGLDNGADGYLTHPVEPTVLLATVRALLRAHEAERAVRDTAEQWGMTFDAIREGVCVTDVHGAVLRCNRAFEDLLGITLSPGDTRPLWEVAPQLAAMVRSEDALSEGRGRTMRFETGERTLRVSVVRASRTGHVTQEMIWVVTDLTRERRADERVRRAMQLETTGRLAGGVAHEVNNMMTAILSYAEFALRAIAPEDPLRADIEGIHAAATRSATVARQLLTFSRRQVIHPRTVNLHDLVREFQPTMVRLLGADKTLHLELVAQDPWVAVDPVGFEQILINLALNARDAMPHGGRVEIKTANVILDESIAANYPDIAIRNGPYVEVLICDTGHGMNKETLDHIFEPFFTTKDVGQGTGLGLATVFGMVKQSEGYIWAESEPDKGTTFRVQLPQVTPVTSPPERASQDPPTVSGTLLVVEDESIVLRLLARGLRESGYRVEEAADGLQGLERLTALDGDVDVVITDIVMPRMNGREMSAAIRERWPGLPVLFISGYTNDEVVGRGLLAPGEAFLQKPFPPGALVAAIQELQAKGHSSLIADRFSPIADR